NFSSDLMDKSSATGRTWSAEIEACSSFLAVYKNCSWLYIQNSQPVKSRNSFISSNLGDPILLFVEFSFMHQSSLRSLQINTTFLLFSLACSRICFQMIRSPKI